jgi:CRISPR-associated protein Csh2
MGHQPRLYLRVEYDTDSFHIGTLDDGLELTQEMPDEELRNITDVTLGVDGLLEDLGANSDHIASVHVIADRHLTVEANGETGGPELLLQSLEDVVGSEAVTEVDPYA